MHLLAQLLHIHCCSLHLHADFGSACMQKQLLHTTSPVRPSHRKPHAFTYTCWYTNAHMGSRGKSHNVASTDIMFMINTKADGDTLTERHTRISALCPCNTNQRARTRTRLRYIDTLKAVSPCQTHAESFCSREAHHTSRSEQSERHRMCRRRVCWQICTTALA